MYPGSGRRKRGPRERYIIACGASLCTDDADEGGGSMAKPRSADLTRDLRDFARERLEVDLTGVAPVERLAEGPEGGRPTDYLPAAQSVVVLALKIPDAAIEVAGRYDEPGKTLGPYMWYGYVLPNWELSSAANRLSKFLETRGFKGLPFSPP